MGDVLRVLAHDRLQLFEFGSAGGPGVQATHTIQVRLVGNVLVQGAARLLLAEQKRQVLGPELNGRLGKIQDVARLEPLAPGSRLSLRNFKAAGGRRDRNKSHEGGLLASGS